jgi:hypothetical protein
MLRRKTDLSSVLSPDEFDVEQGLMEFGLFICRVRRSNLFTSELLKGRILVSLSHQGTYEHLTTG